LNIYRSYHVQAPSALMAKLNDVAASKPTGSPKNKNIKCKTLSSKYNGEVIQ